jgi:hypothetical protein
MAHLFDTACNEENAISLCESVIPSLQAELKIVHARAEELITQAAALRPWIRHKPRCKFGPYHECTCGLDAIRPALPKGQEHE